MADCISIKTCAHGIAPKGRQTYPHLESRSVRFGAVSVMLFRGFMLNKNSTQCFKIRTRPRRMKDRWPTRVMGELTINI